ncbi:pseudouridine-metabolizing bifunctional protein C1861.05 [Pieris rapae]|uniref:pseudouridine-metabolizing bifunctional protein C1861.05 n=1 Tax=Pieris rapae TaxID=64459 RepID=UPI001E2803B6|nr:pseudouridine-metabolizing bifunctional protein C1861.05 [Pieris rapae]
MAGLLKISRHSLTLIRRYSTPLIYSDEVQTAKNENKPIVALESTIITHGMPYPKNLETAMDVENIIRKQGAVPATIAILKGQLTIGLTRTQLEYLAQAKDVIKTSRRDLAMVVAGNQDGATTVAGTIISAELADIPVFVTGGIGGVHRDGEKTLDVSADLTELGRSKTLVVCSGVKSILDIGRTLEYLETQGVTVCAFGESKQFPAFYTRRSGFEAPYNVVDAEHAASVLNAARSLHLSSGIVVAVPVPEERAMDEKKIETAISNALKNANEKGVRGKEITPFLLAAVSEATGGASLDTNIALIKNNAKVGADISIHYQKLRINGPIQSRRLHTSCRRMGDVLVIGGANVDRTYRITEEKIQLDGSTHACKTEQCGGGVGRNIAEALWKLSGGRAKLLTAVGDDADGHFLHSIAPGLILDGCFTKESSTATYAAIFDKKGECAIGLGDMEVHSHITPELVNKHIEILKKAPLIVIDGNIPQNTMDHVLDLSQKYQKKVFFEPTDRRKSIKPFLNHQNITFATPNLLELKEIANYLNPHFENDIICTENDIIKLSKVVLKYVKILIITMGAKGVMVVKYKDSVSEEIHLKFYPTKGLKTIENVSGAGDCFASGFIYGMLNDNPEETCVSIGFKCAEASLLCKTTVPAKFPFN